MKPLLLTDNDTKEKVLVIFGEGGGVLVNTDDDTAKVYAANGEVLAEVKESPADIYHMLEN